MTAERALELADQAIDLCADRTAPPHDDAFSIKAHALLRELAQVALAAADWKRSLDELHALMESEEKLARELRAWRTGKP